MAGFVSSGQSHWKQWWRRSPNTCCSKKILLLLVWQMLFTLSWSLLVYTCTPTGNVVVLYILTFLSFTFAPLIGWLADTIFGRYKVMKFGSIVSFLASILYYFAMLTGGGDSTLSNVLLLVAFVTVGFGFTCYSAAMLPFITDQIIGATSDELSAVVQWYYWVQNLVGGLSTFIIYFYRISNMESILVSSTLIFAVPLAVIIISDCLCQQWLDRTHKVTNPIKLIIQVLNYTRKHSYPERRSAFTYIDEEQPTRMDYGKEKFGGPFTEEEVEDVKTVLCLLPLVMCLSFTTAIFNFTPRVSLLNHNTSSIDTITLEIYINRAISDWLFPVLLIPLYQLLLYRCFRSCSPSMLQCIGAGLFMCILGFILLSALGVASVISSDDIQKYLELPDNATDPDNVEWYWKPGPCIMYGIGNIMVAVVFLEFIIAQSPDKMKGLAIGIMLACRGFISIIIFKFPSFTLCWDLTISLVLIVLFVVFLILSKCYTLRERNREINIQAIVEEHYERYMDQEEEYMRQQHY